MQGQLGEHLLSRMIGGSRHMLAKRWFPALLGATLLDMLPPPIHTSEAPRPCLGALSKLAGKLTCLRGSSRGVSSKQTCGHAGLFTRGLKAAGLIGASQATNFFCWVTLCSPPRYFVYRGLGSLLGLANSV
eukprot:scaffold66383_cov19-Tisochrysis_lutea.AAC.2